MSSWIFTSISRIGPTSRCASAGSERRSASTAHETAQVGEEHSLALRYQATSFNPKFEWIESSGIRGAAAREARVFYVHTDLPLTQCL
jgi:hypothetical protein